MWALFWNIRGFGHDGRRRQLVEYVRDEHIDIIAIQETMRAEFSLMSLTALVPTSSFGIGFLLVGPRATQAASFQG